MYKTIFKACNNAIFTGFRQQLHSQRINDKNILQDSDIIIHVINMYDQSGVIIKCESVFEYAEEFNINNNDNILQYTKQCKMCMLWLKILLKQCVQLIIAYGKRILKFTFVY